MPMADLNHAFPAAQAADAVAPAGGIVAGTPVLTLDGELPVQFLAPGDRLVTRRGARDIVAVEVRVLYGAAMMRIAPGALGPARPAAEIFVAPDQPLPGHDIDALDIDTPATPGPRLPAAADLADGDRIRKETVAEVRLYLLRFARDEVIYAAGMELGCPAA